VDLIGLPAAIQFLTRVPLRLRREPALASAVPWFPVAGALVGAVIGGAAAGLWHVVPPVLAAAIAVVLGVLVTGAFHEDGLADVADAFGGGWTVERRLEILKDPRHGSYGVAAMSASIVVRIVALGSIPGPAAMLWSAVAAHTIARGAAVVLMGAAPIAGAEGLGADYARQVSLRRSLVGGAIATVITAAAMTGRFGWTAHAALAVALAGLAAALGAIATAWLARRKIGGITGDVLGAAEQIGECLVLVVLASTRWH